MSWQEFVDKHLVDTGKVQKAAIIGQKGGVWATSAGYTLTPVEQKAIVNAFTDPNHTQANGIHLAGRKFLTLQSTDEFIYGKQGGDGCVIVKTKSAVVVAEYQLPIQAPEATLVVQGLADHLKNTGY